MKTRIANPPGFSTSVDPEVLQSLLDAIPAPFEPLDVSALDGYLCGVLLQPATVSASHWLPFVVDGKGRSLTAEIDVSGLQALAIRRHAELDRAIVTRQWFDPWIFELEDDAPVDLVVSPWVAGFALAMDEFPALMAFEAASLTEPLALLYRHLDPEDLEDADDLLAEIDTLEPAADLAEAVEDLVRATLLLADVSRPLQARPRQRRPSNPRRGPVRR